MNQKKEFLNGKAIEKIIKGVKKKK